MIDRKSIGKITTGRYLSKNHEIFFITEVGDRRVYGHRQGSADMTWWYATGEHALYPEDDLVEKLSPRSS
jgi:hypothetical protein